MYRTPKDLDLPPIVGESTIQLKVGQFALQFTFGAVHFGVYSPGNLYRAGKVIAHWEAGKWPDSGFFEIMNTNVIRCEVVNERLIIFKFANGIEMHLEDCSDQYESMEIWLKENPSPVII